MTSPLAKFHPPFGGQRPLPRPTLQLPTGNPIMPAVWRRAHHPQPWRTSGPGDRESRLMPMMLPVLAGGGTAHLPDQQLVRGAQGKRWTRCDHSADERWLGHGDVSSQARDTAGNQKCLWQRPALTAGPRIRQATSWTRPQSSRPPTGALVLRPTLAAHASPPACACGVGNRTGDQGQQRHAPDRGPPDPPIRSRAHRELPRTSSPTTAGMYVGGESLRWPRPAILP